MIVVVIVMVMVMVVMVVVMRIVIVVMMIVIVIVRMLVRVGVHDRVPRHVPLLRSIRATATAAPKPLSMLTTVTPEAQLVSMPSSAVRPEKAVP